MTESKIQSRPAGPKSEIDLVQDRIKYLRESTDFVATLFESLIGYAIIAADFDGNIIAFNEGARQIYGYAPEEIIGKQNVEIFFPEEFIEAGGLQDIINDLIAKERYSYEGEKVRKRGHRFPAQILLTLTKDKDGKVVGFIEIVEDLTERKRAEEERIEAQANAERVEQLERERAEAVRSYHHYLALSQREGHVDPGMLPHTDHKTLNELIPDYRDIVLRYIRALRIREDRPSDRVREFARRLVSIRAQARDLVRLHLKVLNEFSQRATPAQDRAFSNDARLVLVELMGNIMDMYRGLKLNIEH